MNNVIRLVVQERPDVGRVLQQDRLLGLLGVAAVDVELVRRGLPKPAAAVQPLLLDNIEARLVALGVGEVGVLLPRVEGVEEADRVRGVPLRERALQETMEENRWYPTTTVLPDGKVLVSSGTKYIDMQVFGGRNQEA